MSQLNYYECKNVSKRYGNLTALDNVDFHIGKNEVVGLLGDNGAGKSTLIKMMSGVVAPDTGNVFVDGKETKISTRKQSEEVAGIETIYQDSALAPTLSIARNLFVGREPLTHKFGSFGLLDREKMAKESLDAIKRVELDLRSGDEVVENLSGGERQGVVIARALYFRTKVLIMDEPTNHLDMESIESLNHALSIYEGTAIFVSHDREFISSLSTRLIEIKSDKICLLYTSDAADE